MSNISRIKSSTRRVLLLASLVFVTANSFAVEPMVPTEDVSDLVVILDTSGSMDDSIKDKNDRTVEKIDYAKAKLLKLIDKFSISGEYNLRLIHFVSGEPVLSDFGLLTKKSFDQKVSLAIKDLVAADGTPMAKSIDMAKDLLLSSNRKHQSLIIFSDGQDEGGQDALVDAVDRLNTATQGKVMVQFFALNVSSDLWASFKELAKYIHLGTLYLVSGGSGGGDYFSLSYDAITGKWDSQTNRGEVGKRLGHIHAEHVHVVSALDRAVQRSRNSKKMIKIDWDLLKREDLELYEEIKSWFESIEKQYMQAYGAQTLRYLLDYQIRPKILSEDYQVSNYEALKVRLGKMLKEYRDFHTKLEWRKKRMDGVGDAAELSVEATSTNSSHTIGLVSAATDNIVGYAMLEAADSMGSGNQNVIGGIESITSGGSLIAAWSILAALLSDGTAVRNPYLAVVMSSVLLSTASGNSSYGQESGQIFNDNSAGSSSAGTNILKTRDYQAWLKKEHLEREYSRYNHFVASDEAQRALMKLLPNLDKATIIQRIQKISKVSHPIERAKILFAGDEEYMLKIGLADVLTENAEKELRAKILKVAEGKSIKTGLRTSNELPSDIQVYLDTLEKNLRQNANYRSDANEAFSEEVDLFLLGVKK